MTGLQAEGREPRLVLADNPGPFTLEGTRSYVVGERIAALIDPGPDSDGHVARLTETLESASRIHVLLTHGHPDHAGGLEKLVASLDALGMPFVVQGAGHGLADSLADGARITTDAGTLEAVSTPGHSRAHLAFHWIEENALFVGDLMLGKGQTTWVGEYPGCVADYLTSLDRLSEVGAKLMYPAHGPPIADPDAAIRRYRTHRLDRIEQVRVALSDLGDPTSEQLMAAVYGETVAGKLHGAALRSLEALVEFVLDGPDE